MKLFNQKREPFFVLWKVFLILTLNFKVSLFKHQNSVFNLFRVAEPLQHSDHLVKPKCLDCYYFNSFMEPIKELGSPLCPAERGLKKLRRRLKYEDKIGFVTSLRVLPLPESCPWSL